MKVLNCLLAILMAMLSFALYSCSSLEDDVEEINEYGLNLVVENEKFSCYSLNEARSENQQMLIKVSDLPSVDIFYEINCDANKDVYPYKSVFYENGKELFTLYSNVERKDDGDLVSYCYSYGDIEQVFFPKNVSRSWGQNTMDCMSDAYSNHGWASVWVFVQSAFIPQTAVAIAAVCAIKNF